MHQDRAFCTGEEPEVETEEIENDVCSDSFEYEETNEIPECLWADGSEKPGG